MDSEHFSEWGSWLNEREGEQTGGSQHLCRNWLGCTGIWLKSEGGANICVDF